MELEEALVAARGASQNSGKPRELLVAAAKVARRTGRLGDRPRDLSRYLAAPERQLQLKMGLRRIPRGLVRDFFIAAPLALTVAQWGLVRQLSEQAILAVVWWPLASSWDPPSSPRSSCSSRSLPGLSPERVP